MCKVSSLCCVSSVPPDDTDKKVLTTRSTREGSTHRNFCHWVCVCLHTHVHACSYMRMRVKAKDRHHRLSFSVPSTWCFETAPLSWNLESASFVRLSGQQSGIQMAPLLSALGLHAHTDTCPISYMNAGDLDSGPHACEASILPAEPSPQLQVL